MTTPNPGHSPAANLTVRQADPHTADIIADITKELQREPVIADFSQNAANEFLRQSGEASKAIGIDAVRLARIERADYVSEKHVRQAAERMIPRAPSRWTEALLVLGGVISGAALQEFLDKVIFANKDPSKGEVAVVFILSLLGIGLLVFGFYRKRR